ncbi:Methylmalonyl-Coa Epimerase [Manis pentadactyla]|nr:Methylmalonyl-Coa Epimerase [Manis pentadactyla]
MQLQERGRDECVIGFKGQGPERGSVCVCCEQEGCGDSELDKGTGLQSGKKWWYSEEEGCGCHFKHTKTCLLEEEQLPEDQEWYLSLFNEESICVRNTQKFLGWFCCLIGKNFSPQEALQTSLRNTSYPDLDSTELRITATSPRFYGDSSRKIERSNN